MPRVCCEEIVSGRGFRAIHQIIFPGVQHAWFDDPSVDPAYIDGVPPRPRRTNRPGAWHKEVQTPHAISSLCLGRD